MQNQTPDYLIRLELGTSVKTMKRAIALGDKFIVYVAVGPVCFQVSSAIAKRFDLSARQWDEANRREHLASFEG